MTDRTRQGLPSPATATSAPVCAAAADVEALHPDAARRVEALAAAFRRIAETRMQGLPVCNPAIEVEAVDFRLHEGRPLGVLVTPWFMNLVILPGPEDAWEGIAPGTTREMAFPAGPCPFLHAHEPAIGPYLACSLFSPMADFPDQETARVAARAALTALLTPPESDGRAASETEDACLGGNADAEPPGRQREGRTGKPLSRRGFLRATLGLKAEREAGS